MGREFQRECRRRGLVCRLVRRDLLQPGPISEDLDRIRPWAVIDAGGLPPGITGIAPGACPDPGDLARACEARRVACLLFSSDQVFDGEQDVPYRETDPVRPLNTPGKFHAAMEGQVAGRRDVIVIRPGWTFGARGRRHLLDRCLKSISIGVPFFADPERRFSISYLPDLVHTALDLLVDRESGLWHLAGTEIVSWHEIARRAAECAGLDPTLVVAGSDEGMRNAEPRPRYSALLSERGHPLPPLDESLARWLSRDRIGVVTS